MQLHKRFGIFVAAVSLICCTISLSWEQESTANTGRTAQTVDKAKSPQNAPSSANNTTAVTQPSQTGSDQNTEAINDHNTRQTIDNERTDNKKATGDSVSDNETTGDHTIKNDNAPQIHPQLKLFGQDFFKNADTTFEPSNDTPVPSNYALGTGDTLAVICTFGTTEYEHSTVTISPDGQVYLKLLNNVTLAGKTLAQAENELRMQYKHFYAKFNLSVTVVGRRTIPIYVMGEVARPGKYLVSSLSTVFTALYAAGGPTDLGSLRTIKVMRDKKVEGTIDIYAYLLKGVLNDIPLKTGDTIYVPLAKTIVTIQGEVRRQAKYELINDDTLTSAIELAGGATAKSADRISLSRVGANKEQQVYDLHLPGDSQFNLVDGDEITLGSVLPYLRNAATIEGAINRPGAFPLDKAHTVADLIKIAEGVTPDAYLLQAQLYRYTLTGDTQMISIDLTKAMADDAKENITLRPMDRLVITSRKQVNDLYVSVDGLVTTPGKFPFYNGMKVSDALFQAGGIDTNTVMDRALLIRRNPENYAEDVCELSLRGVLSHAADDDLPLHNGDRLMIYPKDQLGNAQFVTIAGAVTAPGDYQYLGNMRVSELLLLAKGLRKDAYTARADLYRLQPDHSTQIIPVNLTKTINGKFSDDNPILEPTDRLVVSTISQRTDQPMVKIDGYVRNAGEFPLSVGMKISDLLYLGGGLKPDAESTIEVYRKQGTGVDKKTYTIKSTADGHYLLDTDPMLEPDDLVSVHGNSNYAKVTDTVSIEGEVKYPGAFPAYDGTRQSKKSLYQVLMQAGGLLPNAFPGGIVLYRNQAAIYTVGQQWGLAETTRNLDSVAGVNPPKSLPTSVPSLSTDAALENNTKQPQNSTIGGLGIASNTLNASNPQNENADRIANSIAQVLNTGKDASVTLVIPPRSMQSQQLSLTLPVDAERILQSKGKEGDILLEPDDIVFVPKRPTTVTVIGGVITNGSVLFQEKKRVKEYIDSVGGVARDGDDKNIVVMHVNGQIMPVKRVKSIKPGDIIIVPSKHIVQSIRTGTPIERALGVISQLALSALPFIK